MSLPLDPEGKSMTDLRSAINSGIDDFASDPEKGGTVSLPAGQSDQTDEADDRDEPESTTDDESTPPEEGKEGEESAAGEGAEGDGEPPSRPEGAEPPAGEQTEAAKAEATLAAMPEAKRDAIKKFLPGGKPTSESDLNMAERLAYEDYWRNQRRLAEAAKQPPTTPTEPAPKPGPVQDPPELAPYNEKIQQIQREGKYAFEQINGWRTERTKILGQIDALAEKRRRDLASVDPDDILSLNEKVRQIDLQIDGWQNVLNQRAQSEVETINEKKRAATLLDLTSRLDRQERALETKARSESTKQFTNAFEREVKSLAKTLNVPEADLPSFRELLGSAVFVEGQYRQAQNQPFTLADLSQFLKAKAGGLQRMRAGAKQEGQTSYVKDKKADAPKAPPTKQRFVAPGSRRPASPQRDMRSLRDRIVNSPDWDKV